MDSGVIILLFSAIDSDSNSWAALSYVLSRAITANRARKRELRRKTRLDENLDQPHDPVPRSFAK